MGTQSAVVRPPLEAHPHFILARQLWNAIARGDAAALQRLLSAKSVWKMYGRSPLAGTYVGIDAILDLLARVGEHTDDLQSDLLDVFVGERGGVIRFGLRAARGAHVLETEQLFVFRVAERRISEACFVPIDQYSSDQFFVMQ